MKASGELRRQCRQTYHQGGRLDQDPRRLRPRRLQLPGQGSDRLHGAHHQHVNAVCHRNYEENGSVQVMLFRNRLEIINPGSLPKGWTVKKLLETHDSRSPNLVIAQALNWARFVEKSGNGTESIVKRCTEHGLKRPEYRSDNADFSAIIWRIQCDSTGLQLGLRSGQRHRPEIGQSCGLKTGLKSGVLTTDFRILSCLTNANLNGREISQALQVKPTSRSFRVALSRLLEDGLIEYTVPDAPRSRFQKYKTTEKAQQLLSRLEREEMSVPARS